MGNPGLPHYVAFKGDNGKYLGFYMEDGYRGFLKFGYDDLSSPYVKHEVVSDPTNQSNVHIKCCYNNKFWRREASNKWWIIAGADSINGKQSCWSCTLFDTKFGSSNTVSLRSMNLNKFSARWRLGATHKLDSCLFAGEDDKPDECGIMTYYDLGLLVTLPKYVAFKGDNGKYLAASCTESDEYLQFNTDDLRSDHVRHEVVPAGDGMVRVKCLHWNAKCDVKFSYVREDLLITGDTVKVIKDDGIFNGAGHTDVHFETRYF